MHAEVNHRAPHEPAETLSTWVQDVALFVIVVAVIAIAVSLCVLLLVT